MSRRDSFTKLERERSVECDEDVLDLTGVK